MYAFIAKICFLICKLTDIFGLRWSLINQSNINLHAIILYFECSNTMQVCDTNMLTYIILLNKPIIYEYLFDM